MTNAGCLVAHNRMLKRRHIMHCSMADPAYGDGEAKALGLAL